MSANGFLGSGDLYIDRIVNGALTGRTGPFECEKFEIKVNSELRERSSKGRSSYGAVVAAAAIAKPSDLAITLGSADANGLAIALLGSTSTVTQTAGVATAQSLASVVLDVWMPLTYARVSNFVATGHTLGTDYLLNAELGWVKFLSTGNVTAASTVSVTYDRAAITATRISAAQVTAVRARFYLDGLNLADGLPSVCTAYECLVTSDAAIDFLSDQFLTVPLKGRLVKPTGYTSAFDVDQRN